jgi:cbb3-type cytochrome oxidase subunit 3
MELVVWTGLVVVAFVAVLWSFLRPRRHDELERESHLPLADEEPDEKGHP